MPYYSWNDVFINWNDSDVSWDGFYEDTSAMTIAKTGGHGPSPENFPEKMPSIINRIANRRRTLG